MKNKILFILSYMVFFIAIGLTMENALHIVKPSVYAFVFSAYTIMMFSIKENF